MNLCRTDKRVGFLIFGLISLAAPVEAKVVYVAKTGGDANDGLSWEMAKLTVQAGLNTALSGDQVWVAAGTYLERITLKAGVELYGGFACGETGLGQRDWKANPTILDGSQAGSVVTAPSGATATTRIDGFTIRNGKADYGGGIYCSGGSPEISNNTITGNNVTGKGACGGGIYCDHGSPAILNNTITGNGVYQPETFSGGGGGIGCSNGSPTISDNTITGNSLTGAPSCGGAIYCISSASLTISNNAIMENTASGLGGGIFCSLSSSARISGNTIARNVSFDGGGGIYCVSSSSPTIANNTIRENSVTTTAYSYGGGIYCSGGSPAISNNTVTGNTAFSDGGGIYCDSSAPTIANTIVGFNSSGICASGSGALSLQYSCVYGNASYNYSGVTDPTGANGNISVDPQLLAADYGEVHLRAGSPCIDAADDAVTEPDWVDVDGEPRIQGTHVDIGADEFNGTPPSIPAKIIVRVSPSGNDRNDGSSWELAKRTVQAGIDATAGPGGGDVWVAAGSYSERITLGIFFHVYGGFAGTETSLDQRDWITRVTTLDGNAGGSVVSVSFGSVLSVLDGFTIRNGRGIPIGGGISCSSSSPRISNNTIARNSANYGGGISCSGGSPTISNNTIAGNSAKASGTLGGGGGIYCAFSSSPTISNNTITGNAGTSGGGVCCDSSSPTITNTIIGFNSSGIYSSGSGTLSLRHNCVYGNTAYNYSGVTDPAGTDGNISVDPQLLAVEYGEVHLRSNSPCTDAGDDAVVQPDWVDVDGEPRIQGTRVDIGADEFNGTTPSFTPRVVRVSPSGNDDHDGSSWELAKQTVQAGINAVAGPGSGDVWVAAGTYTERITLKPFVHVYGGFAGTELSRDQRDWVARVTILDGNAGGSVVSVPFGSELSTVDGFTIRNGKATRAGGGIYCDTSSPTIAHNTITENSVTGLLAPGGGIYCAGGSPTISNNAVTGNSASGRQAYGGGVYCFGGSPVISNNVITGNSVAGTTASCGGGIYCTGGSPTISHDTITGNAATGTESGCSGGGIYCSSSPTITHTIVAFNSSGIHASGPVPSFRNNCVYDNTAYDYSGLTDPTGTNGNISVDPRLVAADYGEVHLRSNSPCIDAGDDAVVQPGGRDMDREPRIQGAHLDIGADEFNGSTPSFTPRIVRVSPSGNDDNDGSSWELAKRTVQAAINATADPRGGDVWVAAGTYTEQIALKLFFHVYGGFAGTETSRDQRDRVAHVTILDGNADGSVVSVSVGSDLSIVDGFTIRNGKALLCGGGISCSSSSPTISNNTITANTASSGGGIYCTASSPRIANNIITGNTTTVVGSAAGGGGIYCASSSSPMISNNTITRNTAYPRGGGIYCDYSSPMISNNTITGNGAGSSGGGIGCHFSSPTISNNTITGNGAGSSGGGVFCYYSSPTIANTIVAFNSSGLLTTGSGTPNLRYNCVYGNTAYNYSGVADPTGTDGNISADPRLTLSPTPGLDGNWGTADDDLGDLHLETGSPCIDAGDNGAALPGILTDLDGLLRFLNDPATVDTGLGTAPIVDIGAHEYMLGDFDRDGDIDTDDMKTFAACVSGPAVRYAGDCATADFDKDGDVDQSDFGFLQRCFSGESEAADAESGG